MKKLYLTAVLMLLASPVFAEEVDIPLFEEDTPNLGRQSKPQDNIVLTPDELPDVRVQLGSNKIKPEQPRKAPQATNAPTDVNTEPEQPINRRPIQLGERMSKEQSDKMSQQLSDEIQRYQEAQARQELEKAIKEAQQKKEAAERAELAKTTTEKMPDSLLDLFGKTQDVRAFDVSGFELGMTPAEVVEVAQNQRYAIVRVEHGIPLHRTSLYEHRCRQAQVHRPNDLQSCIIEQAKEDEVYYVSSMTLEKPSTAEKMQILFSSMATDNTAYKIYYENEGDNSLNFTRKNLAKKIRRRDAFWKLIYDTYGAPDDRENMVWGDPQTAYMRVAMQGSNYNAYIILEDREPHDQDYIDATEQKEDLRYKHPFTFAADPDAEDED